MKILGLDLGSSSIGWALISRDKQNSSSEIIDLGCRIIPYEGTEGDDFSKGSGESRNSLRTLKRGARRGYDRYQMRRKHLEKILLENNMLPNSALITLPKLELWELRSKAVTEKVSLEEFGRILLWLNQKRGYKSARSESNKDNKETEYVAFIKSRYEAIQEEKVTIGQYFFNHLSSNEFYRVKENIFPREAYIDEYNTICNKQKEFHPEITEKLIAKIRDEVIYFQRPLKSQKGLVALCEFEQRVTKTKDGKEITYGPKVIHKSSPLNQVAKIWESINNITVKNRVGGVIELSLDDKRKIFDHLTKNEKLSAKDFYKITNLKESETFADKKLFSSGLQGNITYTLLAKHLKGSKNSNELLKFDLNFIVKDGGPLFLYDDKTGEVLYESAPKEVSPQYEKEPLYQLWHTIYSIPEVSECSQALIKNFGLNIEIANKLAEIDFNRFGYGNKSAKVIRKILPYLIDGKKYHEAMSIAGYNHSGSLTNEQIYSKELLAQLELLPKNSLRQPVVEKILNQMINLVNEIVRQHGRPDEIRVELARELKQSKDERNKTSSFIRRREKENEIAAKGLQEFGLRATRNNLIKWRLYYELNNEDKKLNATCIYCGKMISKADAILGEEVDVEHIIPRSKLFDDSQSNKTLAHRKCNSTKGNLTAYDFMKTKSENEFQAYIDRVNDLYKNHIISRKKRDNLLMTEKNIPDDFIDRQLRESQYIARKAREILSDICYKVWTTSGTVTSELRRLWGWEDVTMNLNLPKYSKEGLTEIEEWESDHGRNKHQKEKIKGWTKRDDHRHHAIDALTIACTQQGFIQRFNNLNSEKNLNEMRREIEESQIDFKERLNTLEKYIISKRPFTVREVENSVSKVLISFKQGKKVATTGVRKYGGRKKKRVVQEGIIIPRGQLSEESVYGKIQILDKNKPLKDLFNNPDLIVKKYIRDLIAARLKENGNNAKKALASTKKDPILIGKNRDIPLEYATCYKEEYVIKYKVNTDFNKVDKVVDEGVKYILLRRLEKFNNNPKEAFRDIVNEDKTIIKWYEDENLPHPIHSVRCLTGVSKVVPIKRDEKGRGIGFVQPKNNHHIAIYLDEGGELQEHVCTFWHAVERKKYKLPVIIKDSNKLWEDIQLLPETPPDSFLELLPPPALTLKYNFQQNEMFILGLSKEELQSVRELNDYSTISDHLYRVQKIGASYYTFRHHLETQIIDSKESLKLNRFYRIRSLKAFIALNPTKVKIDLLGNPIF